MSSLKEEIVLGAFLHDIGKILSRMANGKYSHTEGKGERKEGSFKWE